jgi:peptidoglycan hydrolase-like protein with peptidoglycan-binding domain
MDLKGRNLQQGITGDDVRLLHIELLLLNLTISDDARASALFGAATLAAVQQFQRQDMPPPITGIIDSTTVAAINAAVKAQFRPASIAFWPGLQRAERRHQWIENSVGQRRHFLADGTRQPQGRGGVAFGRHGGRRLSRQGT